MIRFTTQEVNDALAWAKLAESDRSYATSGDRLLALVDEIERLRYQKKSVLSHADAIDRHPTMAPRMPLEELRRLLGS